MATITRYLLKIIMIISCIGVGVHDIQESNLVYIFQFIISILIAVISASFHSGLDLCSSVYPRSYGSQRKKAKRPFRLRYEYIRDELTSTYALPAFMMFP